MGVGEAQEEGDIYKLRLIHVVIGQKPIQHFNFPPVKYIIF